MATIPHLFRLAVIPDGGADIEFLTLQLPSHVSHHIHIDEHGQAETGPVSITGSSITVDEPHTCLLIDKINIQSAVIFVSDNTALGPAIIHKGMARQMQGILVIAIGFGKHLRHPVIGHPEALTYFPCRKRVNVGF